MNDSSPAAILRERAGFQPNDTAFTFIDYEQDWNGVAESLTWSQLYRRTLNVAQELKHHGSPGDRAVILAPQGLDYIVAFLGALQAGLIAVPLSVPLGGATDERVGSVLRDSSPAVILTTSAVVDNVTEYVRRRAANPLRSVVEVDLAGPGFARRIRRQRETVPEYRVFAVHVRVDPSRRPGSWCRNKNLMTNFEQLMSDYFADDGKASPRRTPPSCRGCPSITTWV